MANFFYYDANGQKQGPFTPDEVKSLAAWGQITPETVMKTDTGKSGKAGQIKGLQFSTPLGPSPFIRPVSAADNPLTGTVPQPLPSPQVQPISVPVLVQPDGAVPLRFVIGGGIALCVIFIFLLVAVNNSGSGTPSSQVPKQTESAAQGNQDAKDELKTLDDEEKSTALHRPATVDATAQKEIDEFCAKYGTDVKAVNKNWDTLLQKAASDRSVSVEVVKFLVSKGADVNRKDTGGTTPFYTAVLSENLEVAKFLVAKGANVNAKNEQGETALHRLAIFSDENIEAIKFLVSAGADVNAKDNDGGTPLHNAAAHNKNVEVAKCLVSAGANVNAKDNSGLTPLDMVRLNKNPEVIGYFTSLIRNLIRK